MKRETKLGLVAGAGAASAPVLVSLVVGFEDLANLAFDVTAYGLSIGVGVWLVIRYREAKARRAARHG